MADKGVAGVGQGFFSEAGKLKSEKEIQVEERKAAEARKAETAAAEAPVDKAEFSTQNVEEAFGKVRTRFNEQANAAISAVNQGQEDVRAARKIVKEQLAAARDLETALQNGNDEGAQVSRKKLDELQTKRNELAEKIAARDEEQLPARRLAISVGNEKLASVEVKKVELAPTDKASAEIDKPKEAKQFIKSLKNDLELINAQAQDLREAKREVRDAVNEGAARITAHEDGAIRKVEMAEETARKVANDIQSSARDEAYNAIGKLGTDIVRQLISG